MIICNCCASKIDQKSVSRIRPPIEKTRACVVRSLLHWKNRECVNEIWEMCIVGPGRVGRGRRLCFAHSDKWLLITQGSFSWQWQVLLPASLSLCSFVVLHDSIQFNLPSTCSSTPRNLSTFFTSDSWDHSRISKFGCLPAAFAKWEWQNFTSHIAWRDSKLRILTVFETEYDYLSAIVAPYSNFTSHSHQGQCCSKL